MAIYDKGTIVKVAVEVVSSKKDEIARLRGELVKLEEENAPALQRKKELEDKITDLLKDVAAVDGLSKELSKPPEERKSGMCVA